MSNDSSPSAGATSRRQFLRTSTTAAAGSFLAANLSLNTFAQGGGDTLRVGLIGCGGRGTGAANQALNADKNVVLHAVADAFPDRLEGSLQNLRQQHGDRVQVPESRRYLGFDAYKEVINSGVDVVILTTPPGFRPLHLTAAIDAGKHVFCEKPMAVDGPGVRKVLEAARNAQRQKLSLVAGFCWRYHSSVRATMNRIHSGEIGDIIALQNYYNTGSLWVRPRQPGWSEMTYQMRNWYYFAWLGGDHIAEQAVHSLDKMAWAMQDVPPLSCIAHGGRQVRTGEDYGHIFDHFSVVYEYPNDVRGFHACRQQPGCASGVGDHIMGTKGVAKVTGSGMGRIDGENSWRYSGETPNMYQVEHDELFASIRSGNPINDGRWMAQSTLLAIMGRMAAYTGQEITWEQALNSKQDLTKYALNQEDVEGWPSYSWDMDVRVPPVAMPGITPFI